MNNFFRIFTLVLCAFATACNRYSPQNDSLTFDTVSVNSKIRSAISLVRKYPDSAIAFLHQTRVLSDSLNYSSGLGDSYEFLGLSHFFKFNYDSAKYYHLKALSEFEKTDNKNRMGIVLLSLSYDFSVTHNLNEALGYAERSRSLFEETGNYSNLCDCIEGLAYLHKQLNHTGVNDSLMKELISVAEKTGNLRKIANSYYNQGSYYVDQGYLNLAIEAFYKALKMAEESRDSVEIANAMGSVGLANLYLQEYNKAIEYYLRQEYLLKKQNNLYELAITYTNLGEAYNGLKQYSKGLQYHLMALDLRKGMNFKLALSNSLHNVAYTYYLIKDSADVALDFNARSLKIDREIENYPGYSRNYMLMGNLEVLKKEFEPAIRHLELSYELAEKYGETNIKLESSGILSKLYAEHGNYPNAYHYARINRSIADSIVSGRNVKRITQLEMQHEFDKKENQLQMAFLQDKLDYETTLKRNRLIILFALVVLFLLAVMGTIIYKSYLKSRKADKEKEALLKEIHHRVKNNLMVISSLLNLQSGSITDDNTRAAVKESQSRVKSMALIHQLLYQSERFTKIDFPKYLDQLMSSLQSTYCTRDREITYSVSSEDIKVDIDTAIPLGLITNELATNAYKYAFADSTHGKIRIDFARIVDHQCRLTVSDDGIGLPGDFDPARSASLGLKLVYILARQIKARISTGTGKGTEFNIIFSEHV